MSNSSRCPRIISGVNRTLIVLLVIVILEFMVVRWYYTKPDQSRQREPIGRDQGPYLNQKIQGRGLTPTIMGGIDYAVSQIKIRTADMEHSGFLTWPERPLQGSQKKRCQYYNDVAKAKRIVMKNVLRTPIPNQRDVTIVTQTSLGRLDLVKRLLDHWEGPVSVAVHVRHQQVSELSYHLVTLAVSVTNIRRLALHLVFDLASTDNYPINYLRDVAFNSSRTDRLFLLDGDFVTSKGLHKALKYCDLGDREAVVVPAFQIDQQRNRNVKIENAVELKSAWQRRIVQPFKSREFPQGQRATRYSNWRVATKKYMIKYELSYEPYVLVQNRKGIPHYDSRFMNVDWDRTSHIYALKRSGYKFTVLPKVFVLHYPDSSVRDTYSKYKECSRDIWARVTNTEAMKPGYSASAVKWKSENNVDPHRDPIGQRGEQFGQRSEQFGKGRQGKTNDIGLGIKERKPYFSEMERLRNRQNATNVKVDVKERKPTRSEMEKIQKNSKYNTTVGGEERKPKFSERNQAQIITTDVKSNEKGKKPPYSEMEIQKKLKDNMKINEQERKPQFPGMKPFKDGDAINSKAGQRERIPNLSGIDQIQKNASNSMTFGGLKRKPTYSEIRNKDGMKINEQKGRISPFSRMKQDPNDRTNMKTLGQERKPTYSEMGQILNEDGMTSNEQKGRISPFSRMKQDPNDRTNMKTLGQERKPTYSEMGQIQEKKENSMKASKQEGRSPFSKMDGPSSYKTFGKRKEKDTKRSITYMRGLDKRRISTVQ